MTSGIFQTCPIDQIVVLREDRQRREIDPKDIKTLADSIREIGLIHPLVLTREFVLVVGESRLMALQSLGWESVPFQFADEVDDEALFIIEWDENIKRKDIPWVDEINALIKYHRIRLRKDPTWTIEKTSLVRRISEKHVHAMMQVGFAIEEEPSIANETTFSAARRIVQAKAEYKRVAEEAEIMGNGAIQSFETINHIIICDRFENWVREYNGPRFNLIHCDFPYGIGFNRMGAQAGIDYNRYEDSPDVYIALLDNLIVHLDKFAEKSCHIVFWFSIQNYEYTYNALTKQAGFSIDPFPLIWFKSDNTGIIPDPTRGPRRVYETAFFGRRGDRTILRPRANLFPHPSTGKIHQHEKPQEMLEFFFSMFVNEHTSLFDPTCGSGSALRAARALGASRILGLEADEHYARLANAELEKDT